MDLPVAESPLFTRLADVRHGFCVQIYAQLLLVSSSAILYNLWETQLNPCV